MRSLPRLALAVALACATGCGSAATPVGPGRRCRKYATRIDAGGYTQACAFTSSNTYGCGSGSSCAGAGQRYASLSDFIEEASVPNRPRLSETFVYNYCGMLIGSGSTTQTYVYDQQKRLMRIDGRSQWGYGALSLGVTQYTQWDARGRPLSGTSSWDDKPVEVAIVYDDSARTVTSSYGDGRQTLVQQDAFGNTIRQGDAYYIVLEMEEICDSGK